jgi:hypothetical protein
MRSAMFRSEDTAILAGGIIPLFQVNYRLKGEQTTSDAFGEQNHHIEGNAEGSQLRMRSVPR